METRNFNKRYIIGGIVLLVIGLVGIALPFLPFWLSADVAYLDQVAAATTPAEFFTPSLSTVSATFNPNVPKVLDRLVIPKAGINMPIFVSTTSRILKKGGWIFPGTSTPDRGGNTVIFGHRFRYLPPVSNTFYHLDQVKAGDLLSVSWKGQSYAYAVREVRIIDPTDWSVVQPSATPQLTLITCAPLFSTKQRLVVTAELVL